MPLLKGGDPNESQASISESMVSQHQSKLGVQDMFCDDDVNFKKKPVKGYRFCIFTIVMIVILTFYILYIDLASKPSPSL